MNSATLPSPLHLRISSGQPLTHSQAYLLINSFLTSESAYLSHAGAGVARASLARLVEGLKEEKKSRMEGGGGKRKSEKKEGEGKGKKRKVEGK
jgi:hypothetical protein